MIDSALVVETKRRMAVMSAWLDRKAIQHKCHSAVTPNNWIDIEFPNWDWRSNDYRVKPEPLTGEGWAYECDIITDQFTINSDSRKPGCEYKTVRVKWEVVQDE